MKDNRQFALEIAQLSALLKADAVEQGRWEVVEALQRLARLNQETAGRFCSSTAWIAHLLEDLQVAARFDGRFAPLLEHAKLLLAWSKAAESHPPAQRELAFAGRLLSMSRFLNGVAGAEDYSTLQSERNADINFGLGFRLGDGSLLALFSHIVEKQSTGAEAFFDQHFDSDGRKLFEAIQSGQAALTQFMREQMILRYDPVLSQKVYQVPDHWKERFRRLGLLDTVRSAQVERVAGRRFIDAKVKAKDAGIASLRGLAMVFDLDRLALPETLATVSNPDMPEASKWVSLADEVLSRMHGRLASHWHERLSSVFHGIGTIDGRLYDERRFLGNDAERRHWDDPTLLFDDEGRLSARPREGYEYVVRHGDKLSNLTHEAYNGRADYRFVLRQNPQLRLPLELEPGMVLFFPKLDAHLPVHASGEDGKRLRQSKLSDDRNSLFWEDRTIAPLRPMLESQVQTLIKTLAGLSLTALAKTMAIELAEGCAIVCGQVTLCLSQQENEEKVKTLYPDKENPLLFWARHLAAQIRGDIEIPQGTYLSLGSLAAQTHRREWVQSSLARYLADPSLAPMRAVIDAKHRAVDFIDANGNVIVRLEDSDFHAMRQRPWRRLNDYFAPPVVQMEQLSKLWYSDLMALGAEIILPPLSRANQYSMQVIDGETLFLAPMGTPVYPVSSGTVLACGQYDELGNIVVIQHAHGLFSRYTHLATLSVWPGQTVSADVMIGRSGSTGDVNQPGLGLSFRHAQQTEDPWNDPSSPDLHVIDVIHGLWPQTLFLEMELR